MLNVSMLSVTCLISVIHNVEPGKQIKLSSLGSVLLVTPQDLNYITVLTQAQHPLKDIFLECCFFSESRWSKWVWSRVKGVMGLQLRVTEAKQTSSGTSCTHSCLTHAYLSLSLSPAGRQHYSYQTSQ